MTADLSNYPHVQQQFNFEKWYSHKNEAIFTRRHQLMRMVDSLSNKAQIVNGGWNSLHYLALTHHQLQSRRTFFGVFRSYNPWIFTIKKFSAVFFCSTGCNQIIGKTQFPAGFYKIEKKYFMTHALKKSFYRENSYILDHFFDTLWDILFFWKVIIIWNLDQLNHFQNCFKIFLGKNTKRQFIISVKDKA